jgi:hypothetical protein
MSIELKIKSKHLSVESKIIRFEERKLKSQAKWLRSTQQSDDKINSQRSKLHLHRTNEVRNENRATFLARAFIAGKKYSEVEKTRNPSKEYAFREQVIPRVHAMVKKYHQHDILIEQIRYWLES